MTLNGILYFEVDVPKELSSDAADRYMRRVAETIEKTDFENDVLTLSENVTPKFLPIEGIEELKEIPVVPHTLDEDEFKEEIRQE